MTLLAPLRGLPRAALGAGLLVVFLIADTYAVHALFTSRYPGANDFYARWRPTRAWLFEGRSPYADAVTRDTQIGMYGRPALPHEDKALFSYPFYSILFFAPPSLIADYAWASAAWLAVLQIALLALPALSFAWSGWRPPSWLFGTTLWFGLFWYHAARTLILGQFAGLNAALIVAALLAARMERDAGAGILLALSASKPQMTFLLIPGLLLWAVSLKRWRLIGWFAGTMAALLGGSFLLLPSWLAEWRNQLTVYVDHSINRSPVAFIAEALFPGAGRLPELLIGGAILAFLLWGWWGARGQSGRRFAWAAALTLVTTNLIALRTATTDYVMMTPALFLLFAFAQERWGRRGLILIAAAQAALFFGLWALFFATVQGDVEQPPMYLPLPILLFVGLALVRRAWVSAAEGERSRGSA
jgi:hypothetical protein